MSILKDINAKLTLFIHSPSRSFLRYSRFGNMFPALYSAGADILNMKDDIERLGRRFNKNEDFQNINTFVQNYIYENKHVKKLTEIDYKSYKTELDKLAEEAGKRNLSDERKREIELEAKWTYKHIYDAFETLTTDTIEQICNKSEVGKEAFRIFDNYATEIDNYLKYFKSQKIKKAEKIIRG